MTILTLTVLTGPVEGRALRIALGKAAQVGRVKSADLHVMDPAMSRLHFEVRHEGSNWEVNDLGSLNGTFIGKQKTPKCTVGHGDRIFAGDTEFGVSLSTHSDSEPGCRRSPQTANNKSSHLGTIDAGSQY